MFIADDESKENSAAAMCKSSPTEQSMSVALTNNFLQDNIQLLGKWCGILWFLRQEGEPTALPPFNS